MMSGPRFRRLPPVRPSLPPCECAACTWLAKTIDLDARIRARGEPVPRQLLRLVRAAGAAVDYWHCLSRGEE